MNSKIFVLFPALALAAAALSACVANDDHDSVNVVYEAEPNDTFSTGTPMVGAGVFSFIGSCLQPGNLDWYTASAQGGNIETTLYVSDQEPNGGASDAFAPATASSPASVAIALTTDTSVMLYEAASVTPSTPAHLHATLGAPANLRLKITCPDVDAWYYGTIRIP